MGPLHTEPEGDPPSTIESLLGSVELGPFGWVLALALLLIGAFFVALEHALERLRSEHLSGNSGNHRSKAHLQNAELLLGKIDRYIASARFGATLATLALGFFGASWLASRLQPLIGLLPETWQPAGWGHLASLALAFLLIAGVYFLAAELIPRTLGARRPFRTAFRLGGGLRLWASILRPFLWVLEGFASLFLRLVFRVEPVAAGGWEQSADELRHMVS